MRDISTDLRDRAEFLRGQIDAAHAQFQKSVDRIKQDHATKLQGLQANLDAVNRVMSAEQRRLRNTPSVPNAQTQPRELDAQPPRPPQARPRTPLSEMIGLQRRAG